MNRFFLYNPEGDGMQLFATAEARDNAATDALNTYLETEGWTEDVERIMVGEITGQAKLACNYRIEPVGSNAENEPRA